MFGCTFRYYIFKYYTGKVEKIVVSRGIIAIIAYKFFRKMQIVIKETNCR